jgi:hypothetical protein
MGLLAAPKILPTWLRGAAMIGALLFGYAGIQIFCGATLTPLSEPLPFFAYPFLGATLVGCAWVHYRKMV